MVYWIHEWSNVQLIDELKKACVAFLFNKLARKKKNYSGLEFRLHKKSLHNWIGNAATL